MFEVKELLGQINRLKTGEEIVTNNFLTLSDLEKLSENCDSTLLFNDKAIALFCKDNVVNRLYFHMAKERGEGFLRELLLQTPYKPFVVDCVGKRPYLDNLEKTLCGMGFVPYVHMSRWRATQIRFLSESKLQSMKTSGRFRLAITEDMDEIMKILYDTFDPYDSQLPTEEFLLNLISEGLVFCATMDDTIIAVECLQRVGRNGIYSYLGAVVPKHRNSGMGFFIWQYALSYFRNCHSFTSWSDDKNIPANRVHEMLGYTYDGLHDYILVYK